MESTSSTSPIMKRRTDGTVKDTTSQGPITNDGERPKKKFYRQRAHCNPLAHNDTFEYPTQPSNINWTIDHYPSQQSDANNNNESGTTTIIPTVLDIGCGFGGLTMALASLLPKERILGMEIRAKVTEYVRLRIVNARREYIEYHQTIAQQENTTKDDDNEGDQQKQKSINKKIENNAKIEHKVYDHSYLNCSVLRTNSMKFLPNYFDKYSIKKLFICFPDPHFKRKNHCRRIITVSLLSEYAYVLQPGCGKLYCITDVEELHEWHIAACTEHPLFERIDETDFTSEDQQLINAMQNETEEGKKVTRNNGQKFYAIYQRIADNDNDAIETKKRIIDASNFFEDS